MKKRQKRKAREISEKRRPRNREYTLVSCFFVLIFVSMIGYLIYFNYAKSDDFINSPYNTRQDTFSDRVVRGKIISADGQVLAQTNVYEDGTEERTYPYANMFAHVVGYDTNGKSGLESEANFQLLTSHEFFLNQMKNEFKNQKNTGDSVITTLNADLQSTAYNALGDRRGAVVAIEPSTGKILVEMSRPDFDPNTELDYVIASRLLDNKTDRKEKVLFGLEMFAWAFICVVIVAWIGYSAYVKVTGAKENVVQNTVMDTTALDNYISNLSTDASDGTDSTDADTAEEEDTTASTDTDSEDADAADTTADDSETETADKSEEADDTNVADDKAAETADSTTDADSADAK